MAQRFAKDPEAVKDYTLDWGTYWLPSGDTISSVVWTVPDGLTQDSTSNTTTTATVWLSGGTAGQLYRVSCKITTNAGRTDERAIYILVREEQ